jgi:hypothetical protein
MDNLSEAQKHQLAYWTAFCDYSARYSRIGDWLEPQPKLWIQFPKELLERGDKIRLGAHIYLSDKYISVVLHLRGPEAKQRFDSLHLEKEQIEKEIGAGLKWDEKPGVGNSEIILELPNADPENERDWPRQHAWLQQRLEDFYVTFKPRIEKF